MMLRRKIFLVMLVFSLVMVTVIYLTAHLLLLHNINNLESRNVGQRMEQVHNLLNDQINDLSTTCLEWASWNDTYAFMADHNARYINSNLQDNTYAALGLNLIVYADTQGNPVFSQGYDLVSQQDTPPPADLMTKLKNQGVPLATAEASTSAQGIIMLDGRPMMIASRPILDSQSQGPPRGTLIVGRYINDQVVADISKLDSVPLVMYPYADDSGPPVVQQARGAVAGGASDYLAGIDAKTYVGVMALYNLEGQPVALIKATFDRTLFNPIRSFDFYLMIGLLLMATLGMAVTFFLMDRWVLRRLSIFSQEVRRVGRSSDANERVRVQVTGKDEISLVAKSVNSMLDALRQTRDALSRSAEQYRDLFDNASDMIQSVNQEGRFVYTNPAWREALGYRREDVTALKLRDVIHPDNLEEHLGLFKRAVAGERIESAEIAFITRGGEKVTAIGSISCRFVDASPVYTRGIFHDISEIRETQKAREKMYEIEKVLRQSLQEAINKRIEFNRVVAHELKNSLTVLMVSSEMLTNNPEQVALLSQNIRRSAEHLQNRVNEMLDMARFEMGTLNINTERLNPTLILGEMADYIQPIAEKRRQTVRLEEPERLPDIVADKDRLCQILINLLGNASRYTPTAGQITLGAEVMPHFLKFFVRDTGRGIEQKEQERIFEPYYRSERDRDRISGLGLGLALCKMLVEKHGGRIEVASEVGQGTTFFFTIPLFERDTPGDHDVV